MLAAILMGFGRFIFNLKRNKSEEMLITIAWQQTQHGHHLFKAAKQLLHMVEFVARRLAAGDCIMRN